MLKQIREPVTIGGYAATFVAAAPVAWFRPQGGPLGEATLSVWWSAFALFVIGYTAAGARHRRGAAWPLVLQSVSALIANWLIPIASPGVALTAILLVVAAAGMSVLPATLARVWIGVQTALLLAIYLEAWPTPLALAAGTAYGAMQYVLYSARRSALLESERRAELESRVRELESTRDLLDTTVRTAERTRIGRDLHDLMGHHLVALKLQIQAAREGGDSRRLGAQRLEDAERIAGELLADVRSIVSAVNRAPGPLIADALRRLACDGPGPRVTVSIDGEPASLSAAGATALLRAAQEGITNARKHSAATHIRVALGTDGLTVDDDGAGVRSDTAHGTGLAGLMDRCASCGFVLRIGRSEHGGTRLAVEQAGLFDESKGGNKT